MLNFTIKPGEYFTIGEEIKVVILGGTANNIRVMVDAPKEYNIVREKVIKRNASDPEKSEQLKSYYPEQEFSHEVIQRFIDKQRKEKKLSQTGKVRAEIKGTEKAGKKNLSMGKRNAI